MSLTRRPLTSSDADAELFVDREAETLRIERSVLRLGVNVLLVGPHGSGRTSLLRHLQRRSRVSGDEWAYVACDPWSEFEHVLAAIAAALGEETRNRPLYLDPADYRQQSLVGRIRVDRPPVVTEQDVVAMASSSPEPRVVVVDGLAPDLAFDLFGRFRDTLWQFPHRWVVAADTAHLGTVLRPPADAFFDTVVELAELDPPQVEELLKRRASQLPDARDANNLKAAASILGAEDQQPMFPASAISMARQSLTAEKLDESLLALLAVSEGRADELGDSAGDVFRALRELGRIHAGDERLLNRLGLSRSRVVQLLKRLEEEGLVRSARQGRKVMYSAKHPSNQ